MSSLHSITPCIEPGCPGMVYKNSRCRNHYVPFKGSTRTERLPPGWKELAKAIKIRDRYICYVCGGPGADGVDHVIAGDDHRPSNLKAIHHNIPPYCHRSKSGKEGAAARNDYPF